MSTPQFFSKKKPEPIDFSKYKFLNSAGTAENPTPSQPSGDSSGPQIPGAPAAAKTHKYIEKKPDPRHPGQYIYIYESSSGQREYKTETGKVLKEMPHLPPHKQNARQYTHSTVNGMDDTAQKEFNEAREGISRITGRAAPKQSYDNLHNIHPSKHRDYVQGHDQKYYHIDDFQEGYRPELRRLQEIYKKHMKPHWEHIADAIEKGLKVPDEIIDNYPIPSTRAHLQYLRAIHLPEFKNWFGDWEHEPFNASKVTDSHGRPDAKNHQYEAATPKVYYHGTPQGGFQKFAKHKDKGFNLFGQGFYFTDDQEVAESYANRSYDGGKHYTEEYRGFIDRQGNEEKYLNYGHVVAAMQRIKESNPAITEIPDFNAVVEALKHAQVNATIDAKKFFEKYYEQNKDYDPEQDREVEGTQTVLDQFMSLYSSLSGMKPLKSGSQVYKTFLNIRNPFEMEARLLPSSFDLMKKALANHFEDGKVNFPRLFDKWDDKERGEAYKSGFNTHEPMDIKKVTWHHLLRLKQILKDHSRHKAVFSRSGDNELTYTEMHYLLSAGNKDHGFMQKFANYLKRADYDGITYEGGWENPIKKKHRVWIAFDPRQIKDVSNKTFNSKDENIYKAFSRKLLKAFGIETTTTNHPFTIEEQQLM